MGAISELQPMLDMIKKHAAAAGEFLDGVSSAETAHTAKDRPGFAAALAKIKAGASVMRKASEAGGWAWATRYRLMELAKLRLALDGFIKNPSTALTSAGGRPIGYGTAQLWADMAVEVMKGDWEEARERRRMAPAELVLFALGPLGIVTLLVMHGDNIGPATEGAVDELAEDIEDIAEGITEGLDNLGDEAARAIFWLKVGAGVVLAGGAVIGTAAVVRAVRRSSGSPGAGA